MDGVTRNGGSAASRPATTTILTGATGFLGREVLTTLLARHADDRVIVAVRAGRGGSAAARVAALLTELYPDPPARRDAARRVTPLEADLARGPITLSPEAQAALAGRRCRIVHGAASVTFDLPIAEARAINVTGTRRMLDLAAAVAEHGRLERFAYVSTAFVAGARDGTAREDELDVGQRFGNTYEQSKLEAETLVWSRADRLPVTVFRPSIVAGHSRTGFTSSFKVLYWPARAFAHRLVPCVPGDPAALFDIVPVDFVVDAMLHVLERDDAVGRCFHLCAGRGIRLDDGVRLTVGFFGIDRVPPFVSPRVFWAVIYPVLFVALWGRLRRVLTNGKLYLPYFTRKLVFDTRNTTAALAGTGIAAPDIDAYLRRVFSYARDTDWGRRLDGAAPDVEPAVVPAADEPSLGL